MSRLPISRAFKENVQGTLHARFVLDDKGEPEYTEAEDATKHYWIDLILDSPLQEQIEVVTFYLDEDSYYDPVRLATAEKDGFHETLSSYGDFVVIAEAQIKGRSFRQQAWLSDLLAQGHQTEMTKAIQQAIADIKSN